MLLSRAATFLIAWGFVAAPAYAVLGDVVASFKAPAASVRGMARSDARLHVVTFGNPTRVYRVSAVTGSVYGSWVPCFGKNCRGLAFSENGYLWVGNYDNDYVYRCAATTGSVYGSWNAGHNPYGLAAHCSSDGGAGTTAIFSSDYDPCRCWRHAPANGRILSSFPAAKSSFFDIAWDHRNKLVWIARAPNMAYGYDLSGSIVASFTTPATYPYGMAYYGEYLWIGCDTDDYIYRVRCPGNIGVAPASVGRIKALYR